MKDIKELALRVAEEVGIKATFVCGKPDECPDDDACCHHSVPDGRWLKQGKLEKFATRLIAAYTEGQEPVARVIDGGGELHLPKLQWVSANHSLETPIGSKLFTAPPEPAPSAWWASLMEAAAALEIAAMQIKDPDGKRQAQGACDFARSRAKQLWANSKPTACAAPFNALPSANWTEDFGHENGQYQCKCFKCEKIFIGHKRRVVCKLCAAPSSEEVREPDGYVAIERDEYGDAFMFPDQDQLVVNQKVNDRIVKLQDNELPVPVFNVKPFWFAHPLPATELKPAPLPDEVAQMVERLRTLTASWEDPTVKIDAADLIEHLASERDMWRTTDLRDAARVDELAAEVKRLAALVPDGCVVVQRKVTEDGRCVLATPGNYRTYQDQWDALVAAGEVK